ncbi:hypothetical protein CB1_000256047 [Camelus ferus]|nr:hypothetical protein CB1_000256047 [Camelus ferus]
MYVVQKGTKSPEGGSDGSEGLAYTGLLLYGLPAVRHLEVLIPMGVCPLARMPPLRDNFTGPLHPWARPEVLTCTSWGAPIIWDSTFDPDVAQQEAVQQNLTVGLTVFAVGRALVPPLPFQMLSGMFLHQP